LSLLHETHEWERTIADICIATVARFIFGSCDSRLPDMQIESTEETRQNRAIPVNSERRGGDSNSRDPFEPTGFRNRRIQPLCHLSRRAVNLRKLLQPVKFNVNRMDIAFTSNIRQNILFKATDRTDEHEDD
jgi:hypothetical protein